MTGVDAPVNVGIFLNHDRDENLMNPAGVSNSDYLIRSRWRVVAKVVNPPFPGLAIPSCCSRSSATIGLMGSIVSTTVAGRIEKQVN
jgi:hypothetical protein